MLVAKNPPANARDIRDAGLIPGSGISHREGNGNPLQYSCLEGPMDRGAWWATVHGVTKSWTQPKKETKVNLKIKYQVCKFHYRCYYYCLVFTKHFDHYFHLTAALRIALRGDLENMLFSLETYQSVEPGESSSLHCLYISREQALRCMSL